MGRRRGRGSPVKAVGGERSRKPFRDPCSFHLLGGQVVHGGFD